MHQVVSCIYYITIFYHELHSNEGIPHFYKMFSHPSNHWITAPSIIVHTKFLQHYFPSAEFYLSLQIYIFFSSCTNMPFFFQTKIA